MISPADIIDAAAHSGVQAHIKVLAVQKALAVATEAADVPSHAERVVLSRAVLRGEVPTETLALCVLTSEKIAAAVAAAREAPEKALAEGDMLERLDAVWTALALAWAAGAEG